MLSPSPSMNRTSVLVFGRKIDKAADMRPAPLCQGITGASEARRCTEQSEVEVARSGSSKRRP